GVLTDQLWLLAGVAPHFVSRNLARTLNVAESNLTGQAVLDSNGNPLTKEIARKTYTSTQTSYNLSGKLTYLLNESHSVALAAYGNPTNNNGVYVDNYGFVRSPATGNEGTFLQT